MIQKLNSYILRIILLSGLFFTNFVAMAATKGGVLRKKKTIHLAKTTKNTNFELNQFIKFLKDNRKIENPKDQQNIDLVSLITIARKLYKNEKTQKIFRQFLIRLFMLHENESMSYSKKEKKLIKLINDLDIKIAPLLDLAKATISNHKHQISEYEWDKFTSYIILYGLRAQWSIPLWIYFKRALWVGISGLIFYGAITSFIGGKKLKPKVNTLIDVVTETLKKSNPKELVEIFTKYLVENGFGKFTNILNDPTISEKAITALAMFVAESKSFFLEKQIELCILENGLDPKNKKHRKKAMEMIMFRPSPLAEILPKLLPDLVDKLLQSEKLPGLINTIANASTDAKVKFMSNTLETIENNEKLSLDDKKKLKEIVLIGREGKNWMTTVLDFLQKKPTISAKILSPLLTEIHKYPGFRKDILAIPYQMAAAKVFAAANTSNKKIDEEKAKLLILFLALLKENSEEILGIIKNETELMVTKFLKSLIGKDALSENDKTILIKDVKPFITLFAKISDAKQQLVNNNIV